MKSLEMTNFGDSLLTKVYETICSLTKTTWNFQANFFGFQLYFQLLPIKHPSIQATKFHFQLDCRKSQETAAPTLTKNKPDKFLYHSFVKQIRGLIKRRGLCKREEMSL